LKFVLSFVLCLFAASVGAQSPPARPPLGITVGEVPPNDGRHGAWVAQVVPNSAASAAVGGAGPSQPQRQAPAAARTQALPVAPSLPANIGGATWTVDLLAGYFAPPDRDAAARALMEHVVKTLRYNPEWIRQEQAKNDAALRGINAATEANSRFTQGALASARSKMHATAQQSEAFDRVINGSSPYVDSVGNHYPLDNTKTQWIRPGGRTIGTNGASPGPGWDKLKEVPPE
jgi:hypothetical protein